MSLATLPSLDEADLDRLFAALSNSTRRSIVHRLAAGDATISELAEPYDMTLPAVSKHLVVLERAGVITRQRRGKSRHCTLKPDVLEGGEDWISACREYWTDSLGSLADYIENNPEPGTEPTK